MSILDFLKNINNNKAVCKPETVEEIQARILGDDLKKAQRQVNGIIHRAITPAFVERNYSFGKRSQERLATCHPDIQKVMNMAIKYYDFAVLEGHRSKEDQNRYFTQGTSKVRWPNSRHNSLPSTAIDIVPYPIDWEDMERFVELSKVIKYCAVLSGVELEWGWDLWGWDAPHYQLVKK